jgi:hypothetical protein
MGAAFQVLNSSTKTDLLERGQEIEQLTGEVKELLNKEQEKGKAITALQQRADDLVS